MSTTQFNFSETVARAQAINQLRSVMLERIGNDQSACRWAAEKGVFCRGFAQFNDRDLRSRFNWIAKRRPKMTRQELEEVADRWQLARQDVGELPIACDVQQREHDMCRGWDDFSNEQLSQFLLEITGEKAEVV